MTIAHINAFYEAFASRDAQAMVACYAPSVTFSDPVFGALDAARASAMWRMLCASAHDLRVEYRAVRVDGAHGSAHWEAWYTFSATGRPVHNIIKASSEFADGLIVRHADAFDLHRWLGQAFGVPGRLFGGSGLVQQAVRRKVDARLRAYEASSPSGPG